MQGAQGSLAAARTCGVKDESEAGTAVPEIACSDMHDLERQSANSLSAAVHRSLFVGETHAAEQGRVDGLIWRASTPTAGTAGSSASVRVL